MPWKTDELGVLECRSIGVLESQYSITPALRLGFSSVLRPDKAPHRDLEVWSDGLRSSHPEAMNTQW